MLIKEVSYSPNNANFFYKILYLAIIFNPVYLTSLRAAVIYIPGPILLPVLTVHQVGFADSCSNLIGRPFDKTKHILIRVASVAGASPAATLASLGGVESLGPPRPGNPVEGNGLHTRLTGPSHRVVGRVVNCPLSGPPGLSSGLG
jgi:hypothetical protein